MRNKHPSIRSAWWRTVAILTMSAVAAGGCGGGGGSDSSGEGAFDLRVGYIADIHGGGLVTAAEANGFWKKAGVNATLQKFVNGPTQIQALAAGELDIAYIGPGALWLPMSGRGTVITLDSLSTGDALVARPDVVGSVEDLKGKRVGFPEGTSSEMILNLALEKAGLSKKDIKPVPMDQNLIVSSFLSGKIDVAAPFPPGTAQILKQDKQAKILIDTTDFYPEYTFPEVWVARTELVKENPDAVKAWLKAFVMANDWRMRNLDKAIELTAKDAGSPPEGQKFLSERTEWITAAEIIGANKNGDTFKWFKGLNKLFTAGGKLEGEVDPATYTNVDLLREAHEEVKADAAGQNRD